MRYTLPSNRPEIRIDFNESIQRERRLAFRLINDLMRSIEKLPAEARTGGLDDAYDMLEKVYKCRTK